MLKLTEQKVHHIYTKYKAKASNSLKKGHYDACLRYIQAIAHTGYYFYLGFKDDELENMLKTLSQQIKPTFDNRERQKDECVFFDSFSIDNGGLIQQYLAAVMSCGYKIRYFAQRSTVLGDDSAIGKMLRDYGRAEIIIVPSNARSIEQAQFIYDRIMESNASRLFIHTSPSASVACCAFYALPPSITKYKINLTDHTFWIGTRFIDYSFEFRPYGCMLSVLKRGLAKERVLYMPFYPIMNHTSFKGFPAEAEGKVILFSGGAYYKIFDKDDTYFKLVKAILDACPDLVLLFAGSGDVKQLNDKLELYQLTNRFIIIGHRSDITEVFENCDIYLNTYPFGGGLMTQYAAQLGKPIVNYHTPTTALVEEFVCQLKQMDISDKTIEDVVDRVKHLVSSLDYRNTYGSEIRSCVVTPEKFNQLFDCCMLNGINPVPYNEDISFEEHTMSMEDKLIYENDNKEFQRSFTKILGIASLWECPLFLLNSVIAVIKSNRLLEAIKNHL